MHGGKPGAAAAPPAPAATGRDAAAVAAGLAALRRLSVRVVAAFGRLAGAGRGEGGGVGGGGGGGGTGDDTLSLDARPKQHDDVVQQLRQRLARLVGQDRDAMRDPAALRACRGPLLVLHRYLLAMGSPAVADMVVNQTQEALARLEHAIRGVQRRWRRWKRSRASTRSSCTSAAAAARPAAG
ncbi:hypothetical protein MNEG_10139 [Monoraphidium neglectum]|uniref:Uncharacterized protein n=1 Tax=Monoraphidium neglectum TaxID=145388 RepID=A0A0D2MA33_9CHLO|nr:hypothetical protein MNEG_10139 [Monoraphidium neglectum]KIY97821.1 hypothetical protein MNEG_10139 [Monoraphidium neglectum]|eukprot:XP_013896841.1 hypothetical protein MNEG_10139 [Monoraphidium neglectum]